MTNPVTLQHIKQTIREGRSKRTAELSNEPSYIIFPGGNNRTAIIP